MILTTMIACVFCWLHPVHHVIVSHQKTGYVCHTTRCRVARYQKGRNRGSGSSGARPPKSDYWCIKSWTYRQTPYWHWRHYRYGRLVYTDRNHVGVTSKTPRCLT